MEGNVMSEDAPVNTGAVAWPDDFTASVMVRRMQAKLHRWAAGDPGRCFGDLFSLVYYPTLLGPAWERVSTNKGAQTPTHRWRSPSCPSETRCARGRMPRGRGRR